MSKKFILSSVGVYNTANLVKCSLHKQEEDKTVLFLGYLPNSQNNIIKEIRAANGFVPKNFRIKNWFNFLLEDLIRPYQCESYKKFTRYVVFDDDLELANNSGNSVDHEDESGIQSNYFYENGIRSSCIAEFAVKLCKSTEFPITDTTASIYPKMFIDDANKLSDSDFTVLELILNSQSVEIYCAGDFRKMRRMSSSSKSKYLANTIKSWQWFERQGFQIDDNYNQPVKVTVKLKKVEINELVDAQIWNDISEKNLDDIENHWLDPKNSADSFRSLRQKINRIKDWDALQKFSLTCDGMTQAIMILSTGKFSKTDESKELLYIEFMAVAPWNQVHGNFPKKLNGVGSILLLHALHVSRFMGLEWRLGLHSMPQSIDFCSRLGMIDCGLDSEHQNLRYFEQTAVQANELVCIGDPQ